jgi:hypothetical protein
MEALGSAGGEPMALMLSEGRGLPWLEGEDPAPAALASPDSGAKRF